MDWLMNAIKNNPVRRFFMNKKTHIAMILLAAQGFVNMISAPDFDLSSVMTWALSEDMTQILSAFGGSALRAGVAKYGPMMELVLSKIGK